MNKINFELRKGAKYLLHLRETDPVQCVFIGAMKFTDKSKTRYIFDRIDCCDEVLMMTRIGLLNAIDFEHYEIQVADHQGCNDQTIDAVTTVNEKILGAINE